MLTTRIAASEKWGLTRIPPSLAHPQHKGFSAEFVVCPLFSLLLSAATPAASVFNRNALPSAALPSRDQGGSAASTCTSEGAVALASTTALAIQESR